MARRFRGESWAILLLMSSTATVGAVSYDVDYASFADLHGDTTHSYVEVYFRVDRWSLAVASSTTNRPFGFFKGEGDTLVVGFTVDLVVTGESGDTLAHERHVAREPITDRFSGTAYDDLFTTVGMFLPPGRHRLVTEVGDLNGAEQMTQEVLLVVSRYSRAWPMLSDVELALSVARDTTGSLYSKHGLSVLPNARCAFGFGAPIAYLYVEAYNLDEHAGYQFAASFFDSAGSKTRSLGPFAVEPVRRTSVEVKGMNVMGWVDGRYTVVVSLLDSTGTVLCKREKAMIVNRVPTITQPTIRKFVRDVSWIATRGELAEFGRLPQDGKARFIQEFWEKRDPTPGTLVNERKEEHFRRLALADRQFGEPGLPGRDSDQGRVYIQYGPPDDMERHASTTEGRPHQIWFYNQIERGVQFVFVDYSGSGRMTLVHSNARNEIHNEDWLRLVEPFEGTLRRRQRRSDEIQGRQR